MAISKVTLNGVTQMDVTQKTVTANKMLNGITSLKNDGTDIEGDIPTKTSSNLTASGATVTAPAGYYESDASKSVASMTLPTAATSSATSGFTSKATISRSTSDQYINIPTGYNSAGAYYKISAVANGTAGTPVATKGTVSSNSVTVTPSVTNTAGYISGGTKTGTAVTVSASELVNGTKSITSSGTTDVTNYANASVAAGSVTAPSTISGTGANINVGQDTLSLGKTISVTPTVTTAGYITSGTAKNVTVSLSASVNIRHSSDLTANGATITAPAGYYASDASKAVATGTAGTPTATKGAVSNNSITVTPSVTNTTGYITGGTIAGTGVSVAASELVSGSETISRNGTFDVTNLAQVLTSFPDGFNYETGTFSPSSDVVTYNISFSRTHSRSPFFAMVVDATGTYDSTLNSSVYMCYHNYQQAWNALFRVSTTTNVYGCTDVAYRNTNATAISMNHYLIYYGIANTDSTDQNHPLYWISRTGIKATTVSTAYWRAGRTYRWFAIWNSQIDPAWEIGAVNTSTGMNYDITNRMRTAEYIPVNSSFFVLLTNGANVTLIGYNSSHQFVEATSWLSTSFNLEQKVSSMTNASSIAYVRIMGCYSDNADITDIDDLIADIDITGMT